MYFYCTALYSQAGGTFLGKSVSAMCNAWALHCISLQHICMRCHCFSVHFTLQYFHIGNFISNIIMENGFVLKRTSGRSLVQIMNVLIVLMFFAHLPNVVLSWTVNIIHSYFMPVVFMLWLGTISLLYGTLPVLFHHYYAVHFCGLVLQFLGCSIHKCNTHLHDRPHYDPPPHQRH